MGFRRKPRRAEGDRARDAEERLGLRTARLARPVPLASRLPQQPQGRARHSGDHSILEYGEGVAPPSSCPAKAGQPVITVFATLHVWCLLGRPLSRAVMRMD